MGDSACNAAALQVKEHVNNERYSYLDDMEGVFPASEYDESINSLQHCKISDNNSIGSGLSAENSIRDPFPFREPPAIEKFYPKVTTQMTLSRRGKRNQDRRQPLPQLDAVLSIDQVEGIMKFIKSCCNEEKQARQDISLAELEAAFRKHNYATYTESDENHARGLIESFEYLLEINELTTQQWFLLTDIKGRIGGDGKLTLAELRASIDNLCDRADVGRWMESDIMHMLRYMDPNGDGDLTVAEVNLAMKRVRDTAVTKAIITRAGPLMAHLVAYMKNKKIRVKDLFRWIDVDSSNSISMHELRNALIRLFCDRETVGVLLNSDEGSVGTISASSISSGWSRFNGYLVRDKPGIPAEIMHSAKRFSSYVDPTPPPPKSPQPQNRPNSCYRGLDEHENMSIGGDMSVSEYSDFSRPSTTSYMRKGGYPSSHDHTSSTSSINFNQSINTKKKRNLAALQPVQLSTASFRRMQQLLVKSGKESNSDKGPPKRHESKRPLQTMGLQGGAIDVRKVDFQGRLYKETLDYEHMLTRYSKNLKIWKHRLGAI